MAQKLDNKKLLACCANGAGSSLMMEKAVEKVMKKYGVKPAELRHCPVSEGKTAARNYDVVFCARTFAKTFEGNLGANTTLIPLRNVMSAPEIEKALKEAGLVE
ncbi:MAG: PTS sugar transporter subunit IIB [Oscillospiraceae bacterium]|nr:PTS sugar transporter subunit IIB [Oscillospiraceae bacterium]